MTRDRLYALAEWRGRAFTLVDTAGMIMPGAAEDDINRATRTQAEDRGERSRPARFRRRRRRRPLAAG